MKCALYILFLVFNQLFILHLLNSFGQSTLDDHFHINHSHYRRKHFKKHPTGYRFEERHGSDDQFVLHNRNKHFKRRRKYEKSDLSIRHRPKHSNRHLNERNPIKNNYGRRNLANKLRKRHHKKIVDEGELFDNEAIDDETNNHVTDVVFKQSTESGKNGCEYVTLKNCDQESNNKNAHVERPIKVNFKHPLEHPTFERPIEHGRPDRIYYDNDVNAKDFYNDEDLNLMGTTVDVSKVDEIVLIANFSLISDKRELNGKQMNANKGEHLFDNKLNNEQETDEGTEDETEDPWINGNKIKLQDKPSDNFYQSTYDSSLINAQPINTYDHTPVQVAKTTHNAHKNAIIKNYLSRRRNVDDENGVQKASLSLLNYFALGLILFLVVLQLMLLACPAQRKVLKKKLHSKWKKYRGKKSKAPKYSQLSIDSPLAQSIESTTSHSSSLTAKQRKSKKLNRKTNQLLRSASFDLNDRFRSNYGLDDEKQSRMTKSKNQLKSSNRPTGDSLIADKIKTKSNDYKLMRDGQEIERKKSLVGARRVSKEMNQIQNERFDKISSSRQDKEQDEIRGNTLDKSHHKICDIENKGKILDDESSVDEIKINLNDEPRIDKQEEINLKMSRHPTPEKQHLFQKNSVKATDKNVDNIMNLNETIRAKPIANLKDESVDTSEPVDIKLDNRQIRPPINRSHREHIDGTSDQNENRTPQQSVDYFDKTNYARYISPALKHPKIDLAREAKLVPKLKWHAKSDQQSPDLSEKKFDEKHSEQKRPSKKSIDVQQVVKKKKEIKRIPVNWVIIVGDKETQKENMAIFERGDKMNILRLKTPNMEEI